MFEWEESDCGGGGEGEVGGIKGWHFFGQASLQALEPVSTGCFPMKIIWNSSVQPKVSFFAWEVSWGKVLTLDQV